LTPTTDTPRLPEAGRFGPIAVAAGASNVTIPAATVPVVLATVMAENLGNCPKLRTRQVTVEAESQPELRHACIPTATVGLKTSRPKFKPFSDMSAPPVSAEFILADETHGPSKVNAATYVPTTEVEARATSCRMMLALMALPAERPNSAGVKMRTEVVEVQLTVCAGSGSAARETVIVI